MMLRPLDDQPQALPIGSIVTHRPIVEPDNQRDILFDTDIGHEECLGSCGTAPMMRVDGDYVENLDLAEAKRIINELE